MMWNEFWVRLVIMIVVSTFGSAGIAAALIVFRARSRRQPEKLDPIVRLEQLYQEHARKQLHVERLQKIREAYADALTAEQCLQKMRALQMSCDALSKELHLEEGEPLARWIVACTGGHPYKETPSHHWSIFGQGDLSWDEMLTIALHMQRLVWSRKASQLFKELDEMRSKIRVLCDELHTYPKIRVSMLESESSVPTVRDELAKVRDEIGKLRVQEDALLLQIEQEDPGTGPHRKAGGVSTDN